MVQRCTPLALGRALQDYAEVADSELGGITYHQLDVGNDRHVDAFGGVGDRLDVLVNSVGHVIYKRGEYEMPGFRAVLDVNLIGVFHCCTKYEDQLAETRRVDHQHRLGRQLSRYPWQSRLQQRARVGLRTLTMSLAEAWAKRGNPSQRSRAGLREDQD